MTKKHICFSNINQIDRNHNKDMTTKNYNEDINNHDDDNTKKQQQQQQLSLNCSWF